jgi:transposase-like protein
MKKSRFTDSQIMDALKRAESGISVPDLCRELGISTATFYKWLNPYHLASLPKVRDDATAWIWGYDHDRSDMALGGVTPKQRLAMTA